MYGKKFVKSDEQLRTSYVCAVFMYYRYCVRCVKRGLMNKSSNFFCQKFLKNNAHKSPLQNINYAKNANLRWTDPIQITLRVVPHVGKRAKCRNFKTGLETFRNNSKNVHLLLDDYLLSLIFKPFSLQKLLLYQQKT